MPRKNNLPFSDARFAVEPAARHASHTAWAEIDLSAIRWNFEQLRRLAAGRLPARSSGGVRDRSGILAVVKADAYGHGMIPTARLLAHSGADFLGVSDVREGIFLRERGIRGRILLMENAFPEDAPLICRYGLIPTICAWELAQSLDKAAARMRKKISVHVKIDTGMGRLGVRQQEAEDFIRRLQQLRRLTIEGIGTHFPLADTDAEFTRRQIAYFERLVDALRRQCPIPYVHAANSMGLAGYRSRVLNLARPGLMLYGLYPRPGLRRKIELVPAMQVKARIIYLKDVEKGRGISYGHTFVAPRRMKIATVAIGYSDGYFRSLSNRAGVLVAGRRCRVVGNVTMDQIMVDVTQAGKVSVGQEAVLVGRQGRQIISADELAEQAGTISYEVVCNLGNRLPRIYSDR